MANHPSESAENTIGAGRTSLPAVDKNLRESDRVFLSLHIRVAGIAEHGKDLWEEGRTVDVSRRGAAIMVDLELHAGQHINIQRVGLGKESTARVVGRSVRRSEAHVFGVALFDPAANLWDIAFSCRPRSGEGRATSLAPMYCLWPIGGNLPQRI